MLWGINRRSLTGVWGVLGGVRRILASDISWRPGNADLIMVVNKSKFQRQICCSGAWLRECRSRVSFHSDGCRFLLYSEFVWYIRE
jgi:hypothetical protein